MIEWMNAQKCRKVSIDIPSGVCARTGRVLGTAFHADLTVSMACVKAGCEWFPGKNYAGRPWLFRSALMRHILQMIRLYA